MAMNRTLSKISLTANQLAHLCMCTYSSAERFVKHLNNAMEFYDINTPARVAMFLSQVSYDSYRFTYTEDNLGLSTRQLMALYPARFDSPEACEGYVMNPLALAELLDGGRFGNGIKNGDSWTYRPRGLRRLIGKTCYHAVQEGLGMVITESGADRVAEPQGAAWSSAWLWCSSKMNSYADTADLAGAIMEMSKDPTGDMIFPDQRIVDDRKEMWEFTRDRILLVIENMP